jgi:hypothetical protein
MIDFSSYISIQKPLFYSVNAGDIPELNGFASLMAGDNQPVAAGDSDAAMIDMEEADTVCLHDPMIQHLFS